MTEFCFEALSAFSDFGGGGSVSVINVPNCKTVERRNVVIIAAMLTEKCDIAIVVLWVGKLVYAVWL